jgi:heptosyltransferase-2
MKILIVSLDNIGDCVMAVGFADALKKALPGAEISLWFKEYTKDLLYFTDYRKNFYCDPFWDKSPGRKRGSSKQFLKVAGLIKKHKFDCAAILNTDWRKALICRLISTGKLYGINQKKSRFFLNKYANCNGDKHILDCYKQLGSLFSSDFPNICPELKVGNEDKKFVSDLKGGFNRFHVGLHPFSGSLAKNWDIEKWAELAGRLLKYKSNCFIWIIAENYEAEKVKDIFKSISQSERILFSCDYAKNLRQTIALISGLDCFAGNDSGPLHIASAFGVKSVGIFLKDKKGFIPRGMEKPQILCASDVGSVKVKEVFDRLKTFISSRV